MTLRMCVHTHCTLSRSGASNMVHTNTSKSSANLNTARAWGSKSAQWGKGQGSNGQCRICDCDVTAKDRERCGTSRQGRAAPLLNQQIIDQLRNL